jgi:DNA-binding cell septation regulator SpoVG
MTPEIIDVRSWCGSGKIRAFCSVRIGDVTIHGVRLIDGEKGRFIAGPATGKNGHWTRHVSFRPELANKILLAVEAALADVC